MDTAADSKTKVTRSVANVLKANGSLIPEKRYTRRSNSSIAERSDELTISPSARVALKSDWADEN